MTIAAEARTFYAEYGLNAETYDARTGTPFPGETEFYVDRAVASGGPVLEVASGTGRITWPIARAGVSIVGIDLAVSMLGVAESKRPGESPKVNKRVRFERADMSEFSLGETFALAIVPFRAFAMMHTPEAQRCTLGCIYRHLRPGGRLIIDIFDPRLDLLGPGRVERVAEIPSCRHPTSGNTVEVTVLERINDVLQQVLVERWRFTERTLTGDVVRQEEEILRVRWSYRYEMMHLFELCGFVVEEELSDFRGAPRAYGKEQIWVVRKV